MTMMALSAVSSGVNEFMARRMAEPMAVPCVGTIDGEILERNILADTKSVVMGNCT